MMMMPPNISPLNTYGGGANGFWGDLYRGAKNLVGNFGSIIGTGAGALAGNPALGAQIGGVASSLARMLPNGGPATFDPRNLMNTLRG